MSKYKIFGSKGDSTLNILSEVLGADKVKDIFPSTPVVKSASVEDTKKELTKLLDGISNSKQVVKYSNTKKGSVIDISPALVKNAEKEFLTDSTNYLYKMCSLYGIRGAQLTAYKTNLADIELKGMKQNIPHAKAGDIYFNIKSNSLGMGNIGYIKLSMTDSKIIEPKSIYLNKKDKFSFTSEGCNDLLKKCHSDKNYDNEDLTGKTFVTLEYVEQPGIGMQGSYRNLGKYANYFELKSLLKNAGYIVTDKHDINSYEVIPFENTDVKDMLTILKNNGKKTEAAIDAAAFIDKKVIGEVKKVDKDELQSTEVKDNKSKSLDDALGNSKEAATEPVNKGKNTAAKSNPEGDGTKSETSNGKTTENTSAKPKGTEDSFGKSQKDDEFMSRPETGGKGKDGGTGSGISPKQLEGNSTSNSEPAKMLQEGKNKPAKSNPEGDGTKSTTDNGKTKEDTDAKPSGTEDNFGDSELSGEFLTDRPVKSKGQIGTGSQTIKEFQNRPETGSKKEASGVAGLKPPIGSARDKARLDSSKYDKGVKPETQMKNEFDKEMDKCSARRAAIAKYKQASSLNKGDELDANRTTLEHLRDGIPDFFSSWHYLDEGADKFGITRGNVAKYIQSAIDRGYRLKVKADGDSEEDATEKYTRSIADVLGKLKVVKNDGKVPDNLNTKESKKKDSGIARQLTSISPAGFAGDHPQVAKTVGTIAGGIAGAAGGIPGIIAGAKTGGAIASGASVAGKAMNNMADNIDNPKEEELDENGQPIAKSAGVAEIAVKLAPIVLQSVLPTIEKVISDAIQQYLQNKQNPVANTRVASSKEAQGISVATQGPGSMGNGLNNTNPLPGNMNTANSGKLPGIDPNPTQQNITNAQDQPQTVIVQAGELDTKTQELNNQGFKNIIPMQNNDGTFTLTYKK